MQQKALSSLSFREYYTYNPSYFGVEGSVFCRDACYAQIHYNGGAWKWWERARDRAGKPVPLTYLYGVMPAVREAADAWYKDIFPNLLPKNVLKALTITDLTWEQIEGLVQACPIDNLKERWYSCTGSKTYPTTTEGWMRWEKSLKPWKRLDVDVTKVSSEQLFVVSVLMRNPMEWARGTMMYFHGVRKLFPELNHSLQHILSDGVVGLSGHTIGSFGYLQGDWAKKISSYNFADRVKKLAKDQPYSERAGKDYAIDAHFKVGADYKLTDFGGHKNGLDAYGALSAAVRESLVALYTEAPTGELVRNGVSLYVDLHAWQKLMPVLEDMYPALKGTYTLTDLTKKTLTETTKEIEKIIQAEDEEREEAELADEEWQYGPGDNDDDGDEFIDDDDRW